MVIQDVIPTKSRAVPRMKGMPVIGVIPDILRQNPYHFLKNAALQYPDIVELDLGPVSLYLVSNPDFLQRILRDNRENYYKPDMLYKTVRQALGNGLVNTDGDFWLRQRRMMQPYFHRKGLGSITHVMTSTIDTHLATWEKFVREGARVELSDQMSRITMDIVTKTMFGMDTLSVADMEAVNTAMRQIVDHIAVRGYTGFWPDSIPFPGGKRYTKNHDFIKEVISRLIAKRRQEAQSDAVANDLLTMFLQATDTETNEQMTEQQLFDETLTVFVGGYETTSNALAWLCYTMNQHPEIKAKLQAEIDSVLGKNTPTFEDLMKLTYTRKVFMETLRMYPPLPMLPRKTHAKDQLGEYDIPAGANILMFYYGLHHNPNVWENPEVFDPERFTPENIAGRSQFAWLPFNGGPRRCIGDEFAIMEATVLLAMIMQRYDVTLVPDHKVVPKLTGTLRPRDGVLATITRR